MTSGWTEQAWAPSPYSGVTCASTFQTRSRSSLRARSTGKAPSKKCCGCSRAEPTSENSSNRTYTSGRTGRWPNTAVKPERTSLGKTSKHASLRTAHLLTNGASWAPYTELNGAGGLPTKNQDTSIRSNNSLDQIKRAPGGRRLIIEGWNVALLDQMALPPCHKTYQAFVSSDGKLSVACAQRSADHCIGVGGSNLIGLALLVRMLAKETDLEPGDAIWYGMDVHVYLNHIEQAKKQLSREPRPWPTFHIKRKAPTLFDYTIDDFEVEGYNPHSPIRLPIAV